MATIHEMAQRFAALDLESQIPIIIENTAEEAIALNQRQLYTQGIDKDGIQLPGYYNPGYEKYKATINPNGVTDLYLTGAWYKGMYMEVSGSAMTIKSTDSKDDMLRAKYGDDITGLDADSKVEYGNTIVLPAIINYIRTICKL